MALDSDVCLLGTGIAPLVAARQFLSQGFSVLLLNPDFDFFRENSELPLDPFLDLGVEQGAGGLPRRMALNSIESALGILRPHFPGAVESWISGSNSATAAGGRESFHDRFAPHVRGRSRMFFYEASGAQSRGGHSLEEVFVAATDAGLKAQLFEGLAGRGRFPGYTRKGRGEVQPRQTDSEGRGVLVPRLADVDFIRYRNGLLEFVRERLGPERLICAATAVEPTADGVRFRSGGQARSGRLSAAMMAFWTPRLHSWIQNKIRDEDPDRKVKAGQSPLGVRLWEEWTLVSREPLDPSVVGVWGDMAAWADVEGAPGDGVGGTPLYLLNVLRRGARIPLDVFHSGRTVHSDTWASADSFSALSRLCHDFLNWEKFSVRAFKARATMEWAEGSEAMITKRGSQRLCVVPGSDGPLADVVRGVSQACEEVL